MKFFQIAISVAIGLAALVLVEVFPQGLISIFGSANESEYYTRFAIRCFRIYLCMLPLAMVNKGTFIYLQAIGRALASTLVSLTREIISGVFLPILFPLIWGLDGILYSFPVADILTVILALFFIGQTYRRLNTAEAVPMY